MAQPMRKSLQFKKASKRIDRMPRFSANDVPAIKAAQIVAGPEVDLINISKTGACLGSQKSIAPGSYVRVRFVSDKGTFNVNGLVVRSNLSILKNGMPYYHAGVKFSEEFAMELGNCQSILKQIDETPELLIEEQGDMLAELPYPPSPKGESKQQTVFELTASIPSAVAELEELLKGCESNSWVDF
jgi:hypothetical protein